MLLNSSMWSKRLLCLASLEPTGTRARDRFLWNGLERLPLPYLAATAHGSIMAVSTGKAGLKRKYPCLEADRICRPKKNRYEKLRIIREAFETVPGARWIPRDSLPKDHYMFSREKIAAGVPEFEELRWLNWHVRLRKQERGSMCAAGANFE